VPESLSSRKIRMSVVCLLFAVYKVAVCLGNTLTLQVINTIGLLQPKKIKLRYDDFEHGVETVTLMKVRGVTVKFQ